MQGVMRTTVQVAHSADCRHTLFALAQMGGFAWFIWYFEGEGRYLTSFLFSSFLCPVIRHYFETHGDNLVYALVFFGLSGAWLYQASCTQSFVAQMLLNLNCTLFGDAECSC